MKQKIPKICSQIDEESDNYYHNYNFNEKIMKSSLIQVALQLSEKRINNISGIYYLNEYYKRNFILVSGLNYYETCIKNYPKDYILCENNKYSFVDNNLDKSQGTNISFPFIKNDIKSKQDNIYKKFLNPISNYKLEDLKKKSTEFGISLKDGTKNKKKLVLYNDINTYMLNKDIL